MLLAWQPGHGTRGRARAPRSGLLRALVALASGIVITLASTSAVSAALLWTLGASPLTVVAGSVTNFSMTATNLVALDSIRCIEVEVPANFDVVSASAPNGWAAVISGGSGNRVEVSSTGGIGGLGRPLSVTFTIRATALSPGQDTWEADAYSRADCGGSGSLAGTRPTVRVLPGSTPTPAPTPISTPQPTPVPTPSPTATPILPLPTISLSPVVPTGETPAPSVSPRPLGSATPTPRPNLGTGGPAPTPGPGSSGSTPAPGIGGGGVPTFGEGASVEAGTIALAPVTRFDGSSFGGDFASITFFGDSTLWLVPAATIAAPGLLMLIWAAVQAGGALLWAPAVRRLRRGGVQLRTA